MTEKMIQCPMCARNINPEQEKCNHCGEILKKKEEGMKEALKDCPACGEVIKAIAKKCKHCGEFIEKKKDQVATTNPVPETKDCPACGEEVKAAAKKCKHCAEDLSDQSEQSTQAVRSKTLLEEVKATPIVWLLALLLLPLSIIIGIASLIDPLWTSVAFILMCMAHSGIVTLSIGLDAWKLRKQGKEHPSRWWILCYPVYLWKRISMANLRRTAFWVWCMSAVIWTIVVISIDVSTGVDIKTSACDIINEQMLQNSNLSCISISDLEKIQDGSYRATAVLSDGSKERIKIRVRGGMIYVQGY